MIPESHEYLSFLMGADAIADHELARHSTLSAKRRFVIGSGAQGASPKMSWAA
jgi:hypothetical protein